MERNYTDKIPLVCASSSAKEIQVKRAHKYHYTTSNIYTLFFSSSSSLLQTSHAIMKIPPTRIVRHSCTTALSSATAFYSMDSLFTQYDYLESTDTAQMEGDDINVEYAKVVHEKLGTPSTMSVLGLETISYLEFLKLHWHPLPPFLKSPQACRQ